MKPTFAFRCYDHPALPAAGSHSSELRRARARRGARGRRGGRGARQPRRAAAGPTIHVLVHVDLATAVAIYGSVATVRVYFDNLVPVIKYTS